MHIINGDIPPLEREQVPLVIDDIECFVRGHLCHLVAGMFSHFFNCFFLFALITLISFSFCLLRGLPRWRCGRPHPHQLMLRKEP